MKAQATDISGVLLIEPTLHADERGVFFETYNERAFERATGLRPHFVQDNQSVSVPNAVRGLHYQVDMRQGKLVRVIRGAVFDVVVDMRRASPTFGQAMTIVLSAGNRRQLWIPPGFAPWFPGAWRGRGMRLQDQRLLVAWARARTAVERSRAGHCLALERGTGIVGKRQGRQAITRRRHLRFFLTRCAGSAFLFLIFRHRRF